MSVVSDKTFLPVLNEIEELYIDGMSPKMIAEELDLPLEEVLGWLDAGDYLDQN
jgi:hypothetical protein